MNTKRKSNRDEIRKHAFSIPMNKAERENISDRAKKEGMKDAEYGRAILRAVDGLSLTDVMIALAVRKGDV